MKTRGSRRGQGLVEYALLIGLMAIVALVALTFMGTTLTGTFYNGFALALQNVAAAS